MRFVPVIITCDVEMWRIFLVEKIEEKKEAKNPREIC